MMRVPMLGSTACASVVSGVTALRDLWTRRSDHAEFFTLGAASYMDDGPQYAQLAATRNDVLAGTFAPLYAELLARLGDALAAPVRFAEDKALPAFHIWGVPGMPAGGEASLHFDLQYQKLAWREPIAEPLSFTLPVALPAAGGGLSMWDLTYERLLAFHARGPYPGTLHDIATLFVERHEAYTPGELVVHTGHELHRIAGTPAVAPGEMRITLQGHGVRTAAGWQLYW